MRPNRRSTMRLPTPHLLRPTAPKLALTLALALALAPAARAAGAPATDATGANVPSPDDQVVVPQVERREVHRAKYPSNDFEFGLYTGGYSSQDFGFHGVIGARLGYDITEDFFVEAQYGVSRATDAAFRQILPSGVFPSATERLQYYDLSLAYNFLKGEVFLGPNRARASSMYVIGGVGSTNLDKQRMQTFNGGLGAKVYMNDWWALRTDLRDHVYTIDLLGKRTTTQNIELSLGTSFYF